MKIAVLGASGSFGSDVADLLEADGHIVVRASRRTGVDVVAGRGLLQALAGVDVVVDALHINTFGARKSVPFFTRAASQTVKAAREQGVGRIVCLSIAGAVDPRVNGGFGYYKGKAAQESVYQQAGIPSTTVRSTQWFDFIPATTGLVARGPVALVPTLLMAPARREEVARFVADVATTHREARHEILAVRGPEVDTMANFARRILAAGGDLAGRTPSVLKEAPLLGRAIAHGGLIPQDAFVTSQRFDEWLRTEY